MDSSKYTKESWAKLQEELKNATAILNDPDATEDEVNAALTNLKNAQEQLQLLGNKTELNKAIEEASALESSMYTEESWKVFQEALDNAKAISAKDDVSQNEVELH